jgi:hypothetical protein
MNRRDKRNKELLDRKLQNRLFTYDECMKIAARLVAESQSRYDMLYTTASACALSAPPFNFGKKRVGLFMRLFFDQIVGLKDGTIDPELLIETCRGLNIDIQHQDGKFIVDIDTERRSRRVKSIKAV